MCAAHSRSGGVSSASEVALVEMERSADVSNESSESSAMSDGAGESGPGEADIADERRRDDGARERRGDAERERRQT